MEKTVGELEDDLSFHIHQGDVLEVLKGLPENSFDACLTDPPYGLSEKRNLRSASPRKSSREARRSGGFMGMLWDSDVPDTTVWEEVFRVLKPGAFLLAFGGTRTHHRLMCNIEDAGFELRDTMMWIFGSGFPKSLNISKALDAQAATGTCRTEDMRRLRMGEDYTPSGRGRVNYDHGSGSAIGELPEALEPTTEAGKTWAGYGTALKPAFEPIILAMKPCDGTFADNALKHGIAGINIDAGRIGPGLVIPGGGNGKGNSGGIMGEYGNVRPLVQPHIDGRWPANVLLDECAAVALDEQTGILTSGANPTRRNSDKFRNSYQSFEGQRDCEPLRVADSGGASRFFYVAKASAADRGEGNVHPTVKPSKLTEYLAKLVLPPTRDTPRSLLVPYSGSGSEMLGALRAGWDHVTGIEREASYIAIAQSRLDHDNSGVNK